jgi:ATP-binding cassette subfamily B protein
MENRIVDRPWAEHRSAHFVLRFPVGSLAERNAPSVAARLEGVREALVTALGLAEIGSEPIRLALVETVADESAGEAATPSPEGGAIVERGQIRAVYRSDGPGKGLERALVELLLASALGLRADRAGALIDGLLGHVTQTLDRLDPSALRRALLDERRRDGRIALTDILQRAAAEPRPPVYYQVVTSFVSYLIATEGATRFKVFAREFDAAAPDRAGDAAFGKPLAVLEQGWLGSLKAGDLGALPGIAAFLRRSATYLRPYWRQEALILVGVLFTAGFTVLQPFAFKLLIDRGIAQGDYRLLTGLIVGLSLLFIVQSLASLNGEYLNARVAAGVLTDIRLQLFGHLQRLSMGFYSQAQLGDLMSRLSSDLYVIQSAMTGVLVQGMYLVLVVTTSTIALFLLEWRLALLAVICTPLVFLGPRFFGAKAAEASYQQQEQNAAVTSTLQENLGAQAVVKVFGLQDRALAAFREQVAKLAQATIRATFIAMLLGMAGELTVTFIQLMTLAVGAFMVMGGSLSLGSLVAFIGLLGNVLGPVHGLSGLMQSLQLATGGMRRVDELLAEEPQIVDAAHAEPLGRPAREIRLDGVTFSYTGEQTTLRDVGLSIPVGQSVAFVGPSGCGKSTILNLILRFYDPVAGAVTIDGRDIRTVTQASLRGQIGTVLQDTFLFNTSVRENIRLGRPDASDGDVEAAAKTAEIHDLIVSLPQGYNTVVGERGVRLSGGQRQRLAIARAMLRDAPILLFDEATSALDAQTEAAINQTLATLAKNRTTVTVTHRLSSVVHADRIFVLEHGRLVQHGSHAELAARDGLYRQLWQQQEGGVPASDAARLQTVPFFASLDGALLAALADRVVTERYDDGEVVFQEGQQGDRLYVIAQGQVEVVTTGPTGAERRLAVLREGHYFGEMALLRDVPRSATVRARGSAMLLTLDRGQFSTLLRSMPDLRAALDRVVDARARANRETLGV